MADQSSDGWVDDPPPAIAANANDGWVDDPVAGAKPSFASEMSSDVSNDWQDEKNALGNWAANKISAPSLALQTMGNVVNPIWQGAGNIAKEIPGYDAASSAINNGAQNFADYLDTKPQFRAAGDAGMSAENSLENSLSDFAKAHPELAGDAQAMMKVLPLESAVGDAANIAKTGLKAASDNAAATAAEIAAKKAATTYDPIANQNAISAGYDTAKKKSNSYFNLMSDIASGETADATGVKPYLDSIISDIKNTPFHEATPELSYLQAQSAKIGDGTTMPLNDMVRLKQSINQNFNPKRFANGTDTPYSALGSIVDKSLNNAAERIPEFGEAKSLADKNWLNNIKIPYENDVLQKFWTPDDYFSKKGVDSGMAKALDPATQQRAVNMAKNISDPIEMDAISQVLPDNLADNFKKEVINNATQGAGASRIKSAAKAAYLLPAGYISSGLNNLMGVFRSYSPETQALIDSAKASTPTLKTTLTKEYDKPFQNLKASMQQMKDSASEMQPQQYGPTTQAQELNAQMAREAAGVAGGGPKLLPAPPVRYDAFGNSEPPMRASYALPRTGAVSETGAIGAGSPAPLQPEVPPAPAAPPLTTRQQRLAQNSQILQDAVSKKAQATQVLQNMAEGKPAAQGSADMKQAVSQAQMRERQARQNAEAQTLMQMQGPKGYKRGGRISEAQKHAGNYPKGHLKFHGLDISIETAKGETRSGKDMDGKPWKVTMPASYGYIRRTMANDGEHVDCFMGPNEKSMRVYLIDQHHLHNGRYDECKAMLGFTNRAEAEKAYKDSFSDGKGGKRMRKMVRISISEFKDWLKNGETHKPFKTA